MGAESWDGEYKKGAENVPESIAAKKAAEIFIQNGVKKLLDAGCGAGQDSLYLAKSGFTVHGVDFSKKAIEKAKELAGKNLTFECTSILGARIQEEGFDGVYCNRMIQHLQKNEQEEAAKKLYKSLKKGGVAVVSVISKEDAGFGEGVEVEDGTFLKEDGRRIHYFSGEEIRGMLATQGFYGIKVEEFEEFGRIARQNQRSKFLLVTAKKVEQ